MRRFATVVLLAAILTGCGESDDDMNNDMRVTFFDKYGATELGTTKFVEPNATFGLRGEEVKLIDISVDDKGAVPVMISLRAEYSITAAGVWTVGEPLVGRLQWGVGGGQNQVEFDIPSGRLPDRIAPNATSGFGNATINQAPTRNTGRGVQIRLGGTSHVSLYARNDGSMVPLNAAAPPYLVGDTIGNNAPAKILAFVAPGSDSAAGGNTRLERSIVAVGSNGGTPLAPGATVHVTLPPFAKSVRFERLPAGSPILVTMFTNNAVATRDVNIPVNDEGPIDLSATTDFIIITNQSAANINWITAVFDVTP